jgi:hypothetical protein
LNRLKKQGKEKLNMNIVYAGEELPKSFKKSIFLAGPTPRSEEIKSWRLDAVKILEKLGYDGVVFIPEPRNGEKFPEYDEQYDWECKMMDLSDCITFWIPRKLRSDFENIALTTNIEWGKYWRSGRIVIGFPKDAEKMRYIEKMLPEENIQKNDTLEDTIKCTLNFIGEGSYRENGECLIPSLIWQTETFQDWYLSQKNIGNYIINAQQRFVYKPAPKKDFVFMWIMYINMYITAENREKSNELVLSRTNLTGCVLYQKCENLMGTKIILVKEYRTSVNNSCGYVYEIPGGSSKKKKPNEKVITSEIKEELGFKIDINKIKFIQGRQMMGTLTAQKNYLYSYELDNEEMDIILKESKTTHGVIEDTELTYIEIKTLKEILEEDLLDWTNIGMIMKVLNCN